MKKVLFRKHVAIFVVLVGLLISAPGRTSAGEPVVREIFPTYDAFMASSWTYAWNTTRAGVNVTFSDTLSSRPDTRVSDWYDGLTIHRYYAEFDTSSIATTDQIISAKLRLHFNLVREGNMTSNNGWVVVPGNIQGGTPDERWDSYSGSLDSIYSEQTRLNSVGYTDFLLNEAGIEALNKGGITKLGFTSYWDAINQDPNQAYGPYISDWATLFLRNSEGTEHDPLLIIETVPGTPPEENEYPLYTQIESIYPSIEETRDWADDSMPCGTIASCGCAITSTVMLARSYGITKGIDGTDVNPKNFNNWLKANNGYKGPGILDFSQGVKYFGVEENGVQKSFFTFKDGRLSDGAVRQRVASGVPVVSQMNAKFRRNSEERGTHFVLITEALINGQYGVNDPLWYNTENLDDDASRASYVQDYNNQIVSGRDLTYSATPAAVASTLSASLVGRGLLSSSAYMRTTALLVANSLENFVTAPAEMFVLTPGGERLGKDPRTNSTFTLSTGFYGTEMFLSNLLDEDTALSRDVLKTLSVSELESGEYKVYVVGTGSGVYEYAGIVHDAIGEAHPYSFISVTAEGMVDVYSFDVSTGQVALLPITSSDFEEMISIEIQDEIHEKFFIMWAQKIQTAIGAGENKQALQHIETFKTLMKAKKVSSPALERLLERLESEIKK